MNKITFISDNGLDRYHPKGILVLAIKSVRQRYNPSKEVELLLDQFRSMTNECIAIGLATDASSLRMLSLLAYKQLSRHQCPSYYKLGAISRAAGILASRKKSIRRGFKSKIPYTKKLQLVSCYGFKISNDTLKIPLNERKTFEIPLNRHALTVLSEPDVRVRSFTLTTRMFIMCVSKEVPEVEFTATSGLDRNLRNLTYGNTNRTVRYDLTETVKIAQTTRQVIASFKRNDVRIRSRLTAKYGRRRKDRIRNILHNATKRIIGTAVSNHEAIVMEDIGRIRSLYKRGNYQSRRYRSIMNSWSFGEVDEQIKYKAAWQGISIIKLTPNETRGTSITCPRCGERLQKDRHLNRKLWCPQCREMMDRDVVAAINLSQRGRLRFDRSQPERAKGLPSEAMVTEPDDDGNPQVDGSKMLIQSSGEASEPTMLSPLCGGLDHRP